ncbi:MAG: calcium-binding protein [Rhodobacteraceae bacterium]|nr:calcium-binding protein [Paracoccaceae bacterium]
MSTTTYLNQTLDGINPITTLNTPRGWDVVQSGPTYGFLGYLSNRDNTADDELIVNAGLTGTNWQIVTLRYSAAFSNTTTLHDLDAQTGRRIKYLELGDNSDVDLISTRVDYIQGGSGLLHDVKLGSADTISVNLFADQNKVETGTGWIGSIQTGDGDDSVIIGGGGAGYINLGGGSNIFTTNAGWVDSVTSRNSDNAISIGDGGVGLLIFSTDGGTFTTQTISADGWVGSLTAYDNSTVSLTLGDAGGGSIRLSGGNDTVVLGAGRVDTIMTGDGNDQVTMGSGGFDFLNLGSGNDVLRVSDQPTDNGISVNARGGNDTINFAAYSNKVVFNLNLIGDWQNPGAPKGDIDLAGLGYIQATGFENVVGSRFSDTLTGNDVDNRLTGANGADVLNGANGADVLRGGNGADVLRGGNGADILDGGRGRDRMFAGNDADQDIFRFNNVNETALGKNRDKLVGFDSGEDLIDLAGIDANTTTGGNQTFAFSNTTAAAHSVWYKAVGPNIVVKADIDGDGVADFVVAVMQVASLTAGDFIL